MKDSDAPVDLYIAAYADEDAARADWDAIKELVKEKVISVESLVMVSREGDGKIHVKENASDLGRGAVIGAVGGAVVGLIFPPSIIATAAVGAGLGAGAGALLDRHREAEIKADAESVLPPGSSGIVALFEERWVDHVDKALAQADSITKHEVDSDSVEEAKSTKAGT
jgi:uncharacterized membrane protein